MFGWPQAMFVCKLKLFKGGPATTPDCVHVVGVLSVT